MTQAPFSLRGVRPALGVAALVAALAAGASVLRARLVEAPDRGQGLGRALAARGLVVDPGGVVWLHGPGRSAIDAATASTPVAVRAATAPGEPHDIYLVLAKLSPEGVLLDVGAHKNLTETSAVDELPPVGSGGRFAFAEQPMIDGGKPDTIRLLDLAGSESGQAPSGWSRVERLQAAVTRWQQTGRVAGLARITYKIEPAPEVLRVAASAEGLRIDADSRRALVSYERPSEVPAWLGVETVEERRPGKLVNWAVDRVRAVIGSEAMQYIKAIAFSAKDLWLSRTEELSGDTGAEAIAEDLGEESLEPVVRRTPTDPDIGFPPPPLAPWVTPPLPGEGQWNAKDKHPFIRQLPGLPPTFVTTFIRGDRGRKATRVYIAMWDPRLVELEMMAGVAEPKSATGATGPGLIPREPAVMRRLAAAMNAGFQALHGEFGMMADGVIYLPPKPYAATVAKLGDGSTAFGSWPESAAIPPDVVSYRQNMTVMVQDEKFNPYGRTWWGGTPSDWEDRTHTVRTGICHTKDGFAAYFYGAELSPNSLARAMIQARCRYGVALDMNAGHSGMEFYKAAPAAELEPLGRPLNHRLEREGEVSGLDGWKFRARRLISGMGLMHFPRYIRREGRDFFYLVLRHVLPGEPAPSKGGQAAWQVKGLPQHGFPYALALAEVTLPSGAGARVLQLDPRMLTIGEHEAPASSSQPSHNGVVVALTPVGLVGRGRESVWFSPGSFSLAQEPPVRGAVRICSGADAARAKLVQAALGVQDEGGMLVYVELSGAPSRAAELALLLGTLGCSRSIALDGRLPLALGGDTDLAKQGVRLPASAETVVLRRQPGPGVRAIFESTPVVPLKTWYPLQARRIRYFKKKQD